MGVNATVLLSGGGLHVAHTICLAAAAVQILYCNPLVFAAATLLLVACVC
jgi:hypothetical protein